MIVYRFERNGIGPYVSHAMYNIVYREDQIKTRTQKARIRLRMTLPLYEPKGKASLFAAHQKHRLFGCPSKDHLKAYFGDTFKPLFKQGYRIKKYKVPDDEIIFLGMELSFPVKYHKLNNTTRLRQVVDQHRY